MALNSIISPREKLLADLGNIKYESKKCCYSLCQDKPINSHTIAKNYLYKLHSDLREILTFEPSSVSRVPSGTNPRYFRPIDKQKFSTFFGFCGQHDNKLFELIDAFDGRLDQEKAALIHYRNICYGVNHIETGLLRLQHISQQRYAGESTIETNKIKLKLDRSDYKHRLIYCLKEHKQRKATLEHMIHSRDFGLINFSEIHLGLEQPLFSGRSVRLLHPKNNFFRCDGYCYMPWLTYMTLRTSYSSHLVFVWLEKDKKFSNNLNYVLKQEVALKSIIGGLAYSCSDALAIRKEFYEERQFLFTEAQRYRVY